MSILWRDKCAHTKERLRVTNITERFSIHKILNRNYDYIDTFVHQRLPKYGDNNTYCGRPVSYDLSWSWWDRTEVVSRRPP